MIRTKPVNRIEKFLTPAAALVRMSSSAQEKSPQEQRDEIEKLAANCNCRIVKWYEDHGVSGDNNRKRDEFNKLCRDAELPKREFDVILAWHIDRISRNDILNAAEWLRPLRNAGVRIITCSQGEIDLDSFGGVLTYAIHQQAAHQYLKDLSRNMCRSLASRGKEGKALTRPPYAFDRVFYDAAGKEVHRAVCGDKFRKPKGWTATLVPSQRKELVNTVKWIFREFTTTDRSLQSIAVELNNKLVPSPSGKTWRHEGIKDLLSNPVYCGTYVFGRSAKGKFHQVGDKGDVVSAAGGRRKHKAAIVTIHDHYQGIVSRKTFRAAQDKLADRKLENRRPSKGNYPLSGIAMCGHCGGRMYGWQSKHGKRYYVCGNSINGLCIARRLAAATIEGLLCDFARDVLLSPAYVIQLKESIGRKLKERKAAKGINTQSMQAELAKLESQIERAVENLLLLDPENVPAAQKLVREKRERRDAIQGQLEAAEAASGRKALPTGADAVERILAQMGRVVERLQDSNPAIAREAFRSIIESVELLWHPREGRYHELARVAISPRNTGVFNAGNRT